MSFNLKNTIGSVALAGTLALTASTAPALADFRPHGGGGGYHGGGGWHGGGGGWHGGYGGWHRGGGWGWAPWAIGGLAAGAIIASAGGYYGGGYYGDPCYRLTPTYNQYGAYVGRQWTYICQ